MILQHSEPDDFVISTGVTTTVRDFVKIAFQETGVTLEFQGEGVNEIGVVSEVSDDEKFRDIKQNVKVGDVVVKVDPTYFRPTEVDLLIGDSTKARTILGWKPEYDLQKLAAEMVKSDLKIMKKDRYLAEGGFKILNYFE